MDVDNDFIKKHMEVMKVISAAEVFLFWKVEETKFLNI